MSLTPQNISDIRDSWQALAAEPEALTADFYETLFRHDPALRPLFGATDMAAQGRKLAAAIALVVKSADDLAPVLAPLEALGARHVAYGVQDGDYDTVGAALIETMSLRLGARFTPATRDAWLAAYGAVAGTMLAGAAAARRKSA